MSLSPTPRADPWQMKQPNSDVNPALIALVSVIALAFLIVTYYNLLKCCCCYCKPMLLWPWRRSRADQMVVVVQDSDALNLVSPGLDYWVMKMLPVFKFMQVRQNLQGQDTECSVCLLDFQDQDEIRILPKCRHVFHLQCIDMWLTSHASCPLCRSSLVGFEDLHNSSSGTSSRSSHILLVAQEASMEASSNREADSISAELEIVSKEQQQQVVDSSPALNQIQDQDQNGAVAVAGTSVLNEDVVLELVNSDDDEGVGEDLESLR